MTDPQRPEIPDIEDEMSMDWGSDVAAEMLRRLDIEYITLNPGASFRGFHDSLVNYLGNHDPQILLCLHEDHAVAIAHGYAKATGKPMAVALHANVGLMHALLGIFNAWCDRVPMFVIGANGPFDTTRRRPWIDWIHTQKDQGALLRNSVKWDDEPSSAAALVESMLRANILMRTPPQGPVYICLDVELQESKLCDPVEIPAVERFQPAQNPMVSPQVVATVADALVAAQRPVILVGRSSRSPVAWDQRVRLAELSGACVATDLKSPAAFPTDHPLHLSGLTLRISKQLIAAVRNADLVLLLDWIDSASLLREAGGEISARIINCSLDTYVHSGASMEHYGLAPADISVLADPESFVADLLSEVDSRLNSRPKWVDSANAGVQPAPRQNSKSDDDGIAPSDIGLVLNRFRDKHKLTLARVPIAWEGDIYAFKEPLDFLGYDGGGGLSSGPGNTIGAALGLCNTDRRVIGILGDGDFMQAASALWTAARYAIPALFIISNNRSNYTDVAHQKTMARQRARPLQNSGIGQHIDDPAIDLAALAIAQGVAAEGPITRYGDLVPELEKALAVVAEGHPYLLDIRVDRE
ncbi:MAG: thiamine pyrophosphate-binding protein [Gammaproteobacteria bacterium]|nr:thiamine pyrophosphate-binding protein [Gammaproteobacteria bacterium]MDH3856478.1 thiamine pyrophosphate-binding protein [Gammaproteobacteria bacterium]